MNNRRTILLALGIPLTLGLVHLAAVAILWWPTCIDWVIEADGRNVCAEHAIGFGEFLYLGPALLGMAILMPTFIIKRDYQNRRNKTESPSIFG